MSVAKIVEISATSNGSFDDAIRCGLKRADATLKNVKGAWIKDQHVRVVDDGLEYQVNMLVTFILED